MTQRWIPVVVVLTGLGAVACGSDGTGQSSPSSGSTLPALPAVPTSEPADGYSHPTGADEVVVSSTESGGLTTRESAFRQPPSVLIAGDGRLFSPGAQIEVYPGPLLPAVQVQTIAGADIQQILAAADEAGLLADVDYTTESYIADATTSRVTISANGETWVHEAYALSIEGPDSIDSMPERRALWEFISLLRSIGDTAGDEPVGEAAVFEPTEYEIQAIVVDDLSVFGTDGIEPTVEKWPADVSVGLAAAAECTVVGAGEVGELLVAANQLTFFSDDGVTYQLLARAALPGSEC